VIDVLPVSPWISAAKRASCTQETSGEGLLCYALWMEEGTIPKYLRKTRLKCDELEKPHENATSVIVFPAWVSSSWRQFCNRACQI
jgi:hypothetical protein